VKGSVWSATAACIAVVVVNVTTASGAQPRALLAPPAGSPDLSKMALQLTDLPAGAKIRKQGYVKTTDVAEYVRIFREGTARIGSKRLLALENDISLISSAGEASFVFKQFRAVVSTKRGRQAFAKAAAKGAGLNAKKVTVGPPTSLHVGDDSLAFPLRMVTRLGDIRMVIALHRTERVLSFFYFAGGFGAKLRASAAAALARPIARHMHDGLVPANVAAPTITGTAQVGQTLTASPGQWTNSPTASTYQWQHCDAGGSACAAIAGATASTYVVQPGDVGGTIRVTVTATGTVGSGSATSIQTAVVVAAPVT
jgi:hypothetical protein